MSDDTGLRISLAAWGDSDLLDETLDLLEDEGYVVEEETSGMWTGYVVLDPEGDL